MTKTNIQKPLWCTVKLSIIKERIYHNWWSLILNFSSWQKSTRGGQRSLDSLLWTSLNSPSVQVSQGGDDEGAGQVCGARGLPGEEVHHGFPGDHEEAVGAEATQDGAHVQPHVRGHGEGPEGHHEALPVLLDHRLDRRGRYITHTSSILKCMCSHGDTAHTKEVPHKRKRPRERQVESEREREGGRGGKREREKERESKREI